MSSHEKIDYERLGRIHRGDNPFEKGDFFSHSDNRVTLNELEGFLFHPSAERIKVMNKAKKESGKRL